MSTQSTQLEQYGSEKTIAVISSCNDIISECDNGLTAILQESLSDKQPIYFMPNDNHYDRTRILKEVRKHNIETASDDITNVYYYRKVACEERLHLSEWAILSNYNYISNTNLPHYYFRVFVNNFQPLGDNRLDEQIVSLALIHDRTLVLIWDIETYSSHKIGDPLKQICLVDVEMAPNPDWVIVVCENQTNLLKAFALCWKAIMPDIQIRFNNSQYDWPFIIEKAKSLGILEWMYNHMLPKPSNIKEIIK
ncbi:12499_t:CDS:2 [Cetraspora pellucida]|uniref:12499_t:CDS:1 n=1 Tax=Cetraspora pellucida TaxID=1433469 RepID=A0ACA9MQX2_9GLOM|nr:12499_t:CDS:2 [Cetraspora pellucida]